MRIIGLTGSIACGKSNISSALRELGASVIDGDLLSRELTQPGGAALLPLRETFGNLVFTPGGELDRKALGRLVFADDGARKQLDELMQPLILRLIRERLESCRTQGVRLCVLDMPLLFEKKLESLCDRVWCAWLPHEEQLRRLMLRDGYTAEEAEARIRSQLSADEKAARSQIVIDTRGTIEETRAAVMPLFEAEMALC